MRMLPRLFWLSSALLAGIPFSSRAEHPWPRLTLSRESRVSDQRLRLQSVEFIFHALEAFQRYAEGEFETTYEGDPEAFLQDVRGKKIRRAVHLETGEMEAPGARRSPECAELELVQIDGQAVVKYIPPEEFQTRRARQNRFRLIFFNFPISVNESSYLAFDSDHLQRYLARINLDTPRKVLAFDLGFQVGDPGTGRYYRTPTRLSERIP